MKEAVGEPVFQSHVRKPHALVTEVSAEESQSLSAALNDLFVVTMLPETLTGVPAETLASVNVLIPFIHSVIGHEELAMMPHLRLIATRSTGYDHIDLKSAAEQGITVANVPGYGENAVAEYTFALLLMLTRKMRLATTRTQQGDSTLAGLRGIDLYGKTLGVIGTGAIGVHVIRIAKGFGMHVLAYDVQQNQQLPEVLGFRYVSLEELLAHADVVTLHAPATPATYHLMQKETFAQMKQGAFLINTARGSLVDAQALAWALESGRLAGAGLDTLEGEEFLQQEEELLQEPGTEAKLRLLVQQHVLQRQRNVVITPHIAFNTEEALRRIQDITVENVRAFFLGHPQNVVPALS